MDERTAELGTEVAAAIGGDRDAVRAVWQSHRRWVAAVLLAHKPRNTDLEDLLQTVAMQLVRKIHTVEDPGAFKPWLRTVSINIARAAGRDTTRRKKHGLRLVGTPDTPDRSKQASPEDNEQAQKLMSLAMSLPEGYREPLLMRCVRGMSYRQISELMDLPETTIETRIARGRRMLRELATGGVKAPGSKVGKVSARGVQ